MTPALLAALAMQAPAAPPCPPSTVAALTTPAGPDAEPFSLSCSLTLQPQAVVTRPLRIEGAEGSGVVVDCRGGTLGRAGAATTTQRPTVAVWSRALDDGRFSRPTDVTLRRCTIHGAVRIWGMGAGVGMASLRGSSRTADHTAAAQAAAPTRVRLENMTLVGTGSIPLYVGPGVTDTEIDRVRLAGRSTSTAVYLDAESAGALITRSVLETRTAREMIAIDGSARNRIAGNVFRLNGHGGVFLYRNCGEDAVIRHQAPVDNVIEANQFFGAARLRPRTVVVGARNGNRRYCRDDAGWPFGSSADDGDGATGNRVVGNVIRR